MDWGNMVAMLLGGGGVLGSVIVGVMNRRVTLAQAKQTDAQANNTSAEYADKIIEQADKRVAQYEADAENAREDRNAARKERDDWQSESKLQRKAKQEWRDKFLAEQQAKHDMEMRLSEANHHRCEVNGCGKRIPPRNRESEKPEQAEKTA